MDHKEKLKQERIIWKKRIADLESSGLTVAQYAKAHEISVHQFYYWKAKFNKSKVNLPPIVQHSQSPKQLIKVVAPVKQDHKLPDPNWLANFIKAFYEVAQ
ncbi:MAG TPA: hypothetical protein VNJ01_00685 [Bacteriovoracaceae bacterium]|nr:hypothetical protein [Bacteriovoracaceae bacterium]